MNLVTKYITTETAHRLCNYRGKCAHIHGHSYKWEVSVATGDGGVNPMTYIAIDFADLKVAMREVIYDKFDHALVLWTKDPLNDSPDEEPSILTASDGTDANIFWSAENPTAEYFAQYAGEKLQAYFHREPFVDVTVWGVKVWETANSYGQWIKGGRFISATGLDKN